MKEDGPIRFRRFQRDDTPAVIALHVLALRHTGAYVETNHTRDWDRDLDDVESAYIRPGGEFLVGLIGDDIVAMGGLRVRGDGSAELKRMRVHPDHQRHGYGRALLHMLESAARRQGCTRIVLDTLPVQGPALALYESSGFVETHRAERDGIELVFLEKRLT